MRNGNGSFGAARHIREFVEHRIDSGIQDDLTIGSVVIEQPRGTLRGETIKYDLKTGRLDGGGDGKRVQMRILPKTAGTK